MEIRVLKYFLAVAREESISGAAENVLHVTQPTLSRQMQDLEEELGVKLFTRSNRKSLLTDDGMRLRKRAEEIIELVDKTSSEFLLKDEESISGDIYIGGGETDAMRIIARTVKSIREEHPKIQFHMYSGNAQDVTEKLDRGLLDFGILIEPVDKKKYDFISLPQKDTWGLLMRKDSPLAEKEYISPKDLHNLPLIISRQPLVQNEFSGWLGNDFNKLNIIATYNLVYNASLMVDEGVGYALTLDKLVNTSGTSNLCFIPVKPKIEVGLIVVWKKYQMFTKAAQLFIDTLQHEINR